MMKKYIAILFLILPQIIFAELYITPKFNYAFDINNAYSVGSETVNFANFIGGGFSLGYRVSSTNRVSPIRFEFEYSFLQSVSVDNTYRQHYILGSFYYDLNFYFTDRKLDFDTRADILLRDYPLLSLYFGVSVGSIINQEITEQLKTGKDALAFGASIGFVYHITSWVAFEIGYKFLIDINPKIYNEVLIGFRFTIPRV